MVKSDRKPEIRFKGFSDEWKEKKYHELAKTRRGLTYSPNSINQNGIRVLRSSNIDDDKFVIEEEDVFVDKDAVNIEYVNNNDILITSANGSLRLVGKHALIKGIENNSTVHGGFMLIATPNKNPEFLNASMSSNWYREFIDLFVAGGNGAIGNLSKSDLDEQSVYIPSDEEQFKIGSIFDNLDNLINLYQNKYKKIKEMKKMLLEKMFPKNNSNVPEVRWKGFTDAWERHKLLDCVDKVIDFRGRTPKKLGLEWANEGILALSALNVKDGYIDKNMNAHYGDFTLYNKWMCGNELHKGQVLFTTEAPAGNVAQIPDNSEYILSQRTIAFELNNEKYDETFFATLLRNQLIQNKIKNISSGGTAKGVSQKTLSELEIFVPQDIDEQKILGEYFKKIDTIITLHQQKCEKLKNIEKALLNKMFI